MFGFLFRKDKIFDRKRPNFYEGIVTEKEYQKILALSEKACQRIGKIVSIQAGTIKVENAQEKDEILTLHLDNLVRKCKYREPAKWETVVEEHFGRFPIDKSKAKFLSKDFEYAKPLLKVLVRKFKNIGVNFVQRVDIPGTATFLILDYDEQFHFLTQTAIQEWNVPVDELFEIALANVAVEKIDIQEAIWADKFDLFTFFSGDYSASFMVELTKNAPFSIGRFGAVVAIPTKGSAFVHPLNENTIQAFITSFEPAFDSFFNEDEVPVSNNYYWFYEGVFEVFQKTESQIVFPKKLQQLLKMG